MPMVHWLAIFNPVPEIGEECISGSPDEEYSSILLTKVLEMHAVV